MSETPLPDEKLIERLREVIIDFDGIKRRIGIPFRVCGSAEALRHLRNALNSVLERDTVPFHYGWVDVTERPPEPKANTAPLSWQEDGSYRG